MGSNCTGHGGADLDARGADRHAGLRADASGDPQYRLLADLARGRPARPGRERRPRRHGQRAVCDVHQSRAAQGPAGRGRRDQGPASRAEVAGRRRPRRLSQRRQVDDDCAHFRRAAEDCGLPLHDARAEPGRRTAWRGPQLRGRRRAGTDRRRAPRAWASGISFCGTSSAPRCSCTWWTCRARRGAIRSADLDIIRRELELFQPTLAAKPQIVAASKIDAVDDESRVTALAKRAADLQLPFYRVSAATGAGIPELLEAMWQRLAASRQAA